MLKENGLLVYLKSYRGENFLIRLEKVSLANVTQFWEGNIILEVFLLKKDAVSGLMWAEFLAGRLPQHDGAEAMEAEIQRINSAYFFALEPTCGASIYATCEGIAIFRLPDGAV